jgi:hypothetical protein
LKQFNKRFKKFPVFFKKKSSIHYRRFYNSILSYERLNPYRKLEILERDCLRFGKRMLKIWPGLLNNLYFDPAFIKSAKLDYQGFGPDYKMDLNKFFFRKTDKLIEFSNFDSFLNYFAFFPIVQYDMESDHTKGTKKKIEEFESQFEFYEKRLAWDSLYLNQHPNLSHLVKLANKHAVLAKQVIDYSADFEIDEFKNF